jgi:hypothetical protein
MKLVHITYAEGSEVKGKSKQGMLKKGKEKKQMLLEIESLKQPELV